jgi:putative serine protease PepD
LSALGFLKRGSRADSSTLEVASSERVLPTSIPRKLGSFGLLLVAAAIAGAISGGLVVHFEEPGTPASHEPVAVVTPPGGPPGLPDIPAIIDNIRQSVVAIEVTTAVSLGPRTVTQEAAGTGFVLTSDGMIATNAHVVEGARSITVTLADGSVLPASVVGSNTASDLAVIRVDKSGLAPMALGKSANLRVGDIVISVGNALALEGGPTASMGIVSALNRTITASDGSTLSHLIQTDAAINEGDSGGPLTNRSGELVGINTVGSTSAENIGFAIAIDEALPILQRLRASSQ